MPATTHLDGARTACNEARELWAGRGDRKCVWLRCVFFGIASGRHTRPPATAVPGTLVGSRSLVSRVRRPARTCAVQACSFLEVDTVDLSGLSLLTRA